MNTSKLLQRLLISLMIILLLSCALFALIPHHCASHDCAICALLQASQQLFIGLLLTAGTLFAICFQFLLFFRQAEHFPANHCTLVKLKVKLSD